MALMVNSQGVYEVGNDHLFITADMSVGWGNGLFLM